VAVPLMVGLAWEDLFVRGKKQVPRLRCASLGMNAILVKAGSQVALE
jgi:hypothetical protein